MENKNNETLNIINNVVEQVNETVKPELNKKNEDYLQEFNNNDYEVAYQEYMNDYMKNYLMPYNGDISKNVKDLIKNALELDGTMSVKGEQIIFKGTIKQKGGCNMKNVRRLDEYIINSKLCLKKPHLDIDTLVTAVVNGEMTYLEMRERIKAHRLFNSFPPLDEKYYETRRKTFYKF